MSIAPKMSVRDEDVYNHVQLLEQLVCLIEGTPTPMLGEQTKFRNMRFLSTVFQLDETRAHFATCVGKEKADYVIAILDPYLQQYLKDCISRGQILPFALEAERTEITAILRESMGYMGLRRLPLPWRL